MPEAKSVQPTPKEAKNSSEKLFTRGETASRLTTSNDSVCDSQNVRLGVMEYKADGTQTSADDKKARAQSLATDLSAVKTQPPVFEKAITADDINNLSGKIAKLTAADGKFAGVFINCLGNTGDLASTIAMVTFVEYLSQHAGTDIPQEQLITEAYKAVNAVLGAYGRNRKIQTPQLAIAIVAKNGDVTAINTGGNDVAILQENGTLNGSVIGKKEANGQPEVQKAKMKAGEKIVLCGEGKINGLVTKMQAEKRQYKIDEIVDSLTAGEKAETQEKKPLSGNKHYVKKARIFTDNHGGGDDFISGIDATKPVGVRNADQVILDDFLSGLGEDEMVIMNGDAIDRGNNSWESMQRVRTLVEQGRAVYNIGNHELMMLAGLSGDARSFLDWFYNGGDKTIIGALKASGKNQKLVGDYEAIWGQDLQDVTQARAQERTALETQLKQQNASQGEIDRQLHVFDYSSEQMATAQFVQEALRGDTPRMELYKQLNQTVQQSEDFKSLESFLYKNLNTFTFVDDVLSTHAGFVVDTDGNLKDIPIDQNLLSQENRGKDMKGLKGMLIIQDEIRKGNKKFVAALARLDENDNPFFVRKDFQAVVADPAKGSLLRAQLNAQAKELFDINEVQLTFVGHDSTLGGKALRTKSLNPRWYGGDMDYAASGKRAILKLIVPDEDSQSVVVIAEDPVSHKRGKLEYKYANISQKVEQKGTEKPGKSAAAGNTQEQEALKKLKPAPVEKKEKAARHKFPYFEDLETFENLDGIEAKLIRSKTVVVDPKTGERKVIDINYLKEVDRLLEETAKLSSKKDRARDFNYRQGLLDDLANRVRFPGDYKDKQDDPIYLLTKILPDQEVLLMAIEAKQAFLNRDENAEMVNRKKKKQEAAAKGLHRREVQTLVNHQDIVAEISGKNEKFFDKDGKVQEIPGDDLASFSFVADILMDTPDKSLGTGADSKPLTYRQKFQTLLTDAATNAESNQQLLVARREFYKHAVEALKKREITIPTEPPKTDAETVEQEMRIKIQSLQYEISQGVQADELVKKYQGVNAAVSERTKTKINNLLVKYPGAMIDMALKGGDLMQRRAAYETPEEIEIEKPHPVPDKIFHKRFVQGPQTLEEVAQGIKSPPVAPVPGKKGPDENGPDTSQNNPPGGGVGGRPGWRKPPLAPAKPPGENKNGTENPQPSEQTDHPTPPVAPPRSPGAPGVPGSTPLQTEVTMGIAATKKTIEHQDEIKKKKVAGKEVLEQRGEEFARARMTEDREKWGGKIPSLHTIISRFWKYTFADTATMAKEKSFGMKMHAEGGIQLNRLPYEFMKQIEDQARLNIKDKRQGLKRFTGAVKDFVHELTFTEKELHAEQLKIMNQMRQAMENPANLVNVQGYGSLMENYLKVMTGDFQAAEQLAKRVNSQFGDELTHAVVGETRAGQAVKLEGPVANFFKNDIIQPLLTEGYRNGTISEQTLRSARMKIQEFFFKPEFIHWYDQQSAEVQNSLKLSLSYGTDLIPLIQETILPQLLQAKEHEASAVDLDNYVKNMVLKANVGTLETAEKGSLNEGILERLAARHITYQHVMDIYQEMRATNTAPRLIPDTYAKAAVGRSQLIGRLASLGGSNVTVGIATGIALWAGKATIGGWGRLFVPFFGGSLAAAPIRAWQEGRLVYREYEQHMIERQQGYTFAKDAKRRQELMREVEAYDMTQANAQDYMKDMNSISQPIEKALEKINRNENLTDAELMAVIGNVADASARINLGYIRGQGLLKASGAQAPEVEKTRLEVANASAKRTLRNYLANHQTQLTNVQTTLQLVAPANINAVDHILNQLTLALENNLTTGIGINTEYQAALGNLTIEQKQSIDQREKAFAHLRHKRMLVAAGTTIVAGAGMGLLSEAASAIVHAGVDVTSHTALVGLYERVGWLNKENADISSPYSHLLGDNNDIHFKLPPGYQYDATPGHQAIIDANKNVAIDLNQYHINVDANNHLNITDAHGNHVPNTVLEKDGWHLGTATKNDTVDIYKPIAGPPLSEHISDSNFVQHIPPGTHWESVPGTHQFNLVNDKTGTHLYDKVEFGADGKVTNVDPNSLALQHGGKITDGAAHSIRDPSHDVPGTSHTEIDRTAIPNLQTGKLVNSSNGYSFQADPANHALHVFHNGQPVVTEHPIKIDFVGSPEQMQAVVSYDGVAQNTVPSNLLDALAATGTKVSTLVPDRVSNADWSHYLNSLGPNHTIIMDVNNMSGHMIGTPGTPQVPWPPTPSGEHFPFTNKAFANFFEGNQHADASHIFSDGHLDKATNIIHWDNGATSELTPEMAHAYDLAQNGGLKSGDGWAWMIQRPAPPGENFNDGFNGAIISNGQMKVDVDSQFVGKVWASFGYLDKEGIFHKMAGFGPTESMKAPIDFFHTVTTEPTLAYKAIYDQDFTVPEITKEMPVFTLDRVQTDGVALIPFFWPRRPLEAPEEAPSVINPPPQPPPQPPPPITPPKNGTPTKGGKGDYAGIRRRGGISPKHPPKPPSVPENKRKGKKRKEEIDVLAETRNNAAETNFGKPYDQLSDEQKKLINDRINAAANSTNKQPASSSTNQEVSDRSGEKQLNDEKPKKKNGEIIIDPNDPKEYLANQIYGTGYEELKQDQKAIIDEGVETLPGIDPIDQVAQQTFNKPYDELADNEKAQVDNIIAESVPQTPQNQLAKKIYGKSFDQLQDPEKKVINEGVATANISPLEQIAKRSFRKPYKQLLPEEKKIVDAAMVDLLVGQILSGKKPEEALRGIDDEKIKKEALNKITNSKKNNTQSKPPAPASSTDQTNAQTPTIEPNSSNEGEPQVGHELNLSIDDNLAAALRELEGVI